jgi:hypothetical protein
MERNRRKHLQITLDLIYNYSPTNSKTSLERVKKNHIYNKEAYAYLVEKMAQQIWDEI